MPAYKFYNGAPPTTAKFVVQPTGANAIRTQLQIAAHANVGFEVVEWGISFDGTVAAAPVAVELIETDVAASVMTAHTSTSYLRQRPTDVPSSVQLGAALTAYATGAVTEGAITATRVLDFQLVPPTGAYRWQWPLGERPEVGIAKFLRIRTHAPAAVNCACDVTTRE